MKTGRRIILILIVLFIVFYIITRPDQAAQVVQAIGNWILGALLAIAHFFAALAG